MFVDACHRMEGPIGSSESFDLILDALVVLSRYVSSRGHGNVWRPFGRRR